MGFSVTKRTGACLALSLVSALASAEDLATVFDQALTHDPTYQSAEHTFYANKEIFPQSLAQMLPTATGAWSSTGTHSGFNSLGGYNLQSRELSIKQPILHIEHWAQLAKSRQQVHQAEATYSAALQDLVIRVAQKYFDILSAQDELSFRRAQRKTFSRHLEQTQQRFDVGLIAITDVHDAKARHDNAVAKEIAAENALADQLELMRELTGTSLERIAGIPDGEQAIPLLSPEPADIEEWVNVAIEQNRELAAAHYAVEVAKDEVWRQRAGHYPRFDVDVSFKRANSTPPLNHTVDTKSAGLTMMMPILQGGAVLSKTREARAGRSKARDDYQRVHNAVTSQARRAYRGILTEISSVQSLSQAVLSNRSALEATQAAYEVGTRTIVDVLDAQTSLLSAERDKSLAYYAYLIEILKLKQAAGTLSPEDLYNINAWLSTSSIPLDLPLS